MTERQMIIAKHRARLLARNTLKADVNRAKTDLNPKRQADLFVDRQKASARETSDKVISVARQNAVLIGVTGVATLLFVMRQPIVNLVARLRQDKQNSISND